MFFDMLNYQNKDWEKTRQFIDCLIFVFRYGFESQFHYKKD